MSATASRQTLKSLDEALAELLDQAAPLNRFEAVSTFDADSRVLAEDVVAAVDVPAHDNSAMDGYAVRAADWLSAATVLHVNQRIAAGSIGTPLAAMSAARIFTGAPIPEGADAVVMQEDCEVVEGGGNHVRVMRVPPVGQWIRRAGEDIERGTTVLQKGQRLSPASLGLAASIGLAHVPVAPRPKVALFSTGDELVMPGEVPPEHMKPGSIYRMNERNCVHFVAEAAGIVGFRLPDAKGLMKRPTSYLMAVAAANKDFPTLKMVPKK